MATISANLARPRIVGRSSRVRVLAGVGLAATVLGASIAMSNAVTGATVSGTTTVTASANDNVGVAGVTFYLDGHALGSEYTAAPYSASWNTTTSANGAHTLSAVARDVLGQRSAPGAYRRETAFLREQAAHRCVARSPCRSAHLFFSDGLNQAGGLRLA